MKRKGISPLIAAVLLIAFTMAIASIFAQWAPQLMNQAQGDSSEQAQEIQRCSDMTLDLRVDTEATKPSVSIQQTGGSQGVGNLTVTWYWENLEPTQNTTDETSQITDRRGVTTIDSEIDGTPTELQVQAIDCEGAPGATWKAN